MNSNSANKNTESAWMQITAGQGPRECGWVVTRLSNIITHAAAKAGLSVEWMESQAFDKAPHKQDATGAAIYRSVILRIEGIDTARFTQTWQGSILWQGESPYRSGHKRRNWFVGVNTFQLPAISEPGEAELLTRIKMETMRASGAGGQHINKTNSAVRITHLPTGIQVRMDSERSQHKNRQLALERLRMLLEEQHRRELKRVEQTHWRNHHQLERGAPRRIFTGLDFTEK